MRLMQPLSNGVSRSKAAAVLAFGCLAFIPGVWAQEGSQPGFFVYPSNTKDKKTGATYVEVVGVQCDKFTAGVTETKCKKVEIKKAARPYNFKELPAVLLFGTGSFCYYDVARGVWMCI